MEKCPNCGCVDFEFYGEIESDKTVMRIYHCADCNCKKQVFLQKDKEIFWSPTGTMLKRKYF